MTVKEKKGAKQSGEIPLHRILREVLRHYIEFRELVGGYGQSGEGADGRKDTIEHSYLYEDANGDEQKATVIVSFWDLQKGLASLAKRKREAIWFNVIEDKKQKDVAKLMGITTVSVGQYVEAGMVQLAKTYFAERDDTE